MFSEDVTWSLNILIDFSRQVSKYEKDGPNQKVNLCATLSMGTKEPKKIDIKSGQTLTVKEDCILEDGSNTMELHIWVPLFAQLRNNKAYYFKYLTLRYYQGSKFLSTNKNTSHTKNPQPLNSKWDQKCWQIQTEIVVIQLKFVANLNIFIACQLCKRRVGDESGELVRWQNCKVRHQVINCKPESSGDAELCLTAFTNEIKDLLKNTAERIRSTVGDIEECPHGTNGWLIKLSSM